MSTPAPASPIGKPGEYDFRRPYRNYTLDDLVEMLEYQYDQEQPFNEFMVFELAHRAVEAERLVDRAHQPVASYRPPPR